LGVLVVSRLIQAVFTLLGVSIALFFLSHASGNPVDAFVPIEASPEDRERLIHHLGFDKPVYVQYWRFITHAVRGDFGESLRNKQPNMSLVKARFWNSIKLASAALLWALCISLPLGTLAAVHRGRFWDRVAMTLALFGQSLPAFFTGILLIYIFAVVFNVLPVQGAGSWKHYILPTIALGWGVSAALTRLLRSSMLEVLDSEYIKLARAKGLRESIVVWKHALRNALIPLVTFIGFTWGVIMGGAIATEVVFGWPGMARLAYEAVVTRDTPLLQSVVLVWASIIIGANLVVDLLYGVIDPTIRA